MITTADCEFNPKSGDLVLSSHLLGGKFPPTITIKSHITGKELTFTTIGPEHPRYDEDHWDGEKALYEPTDRSTKVTLLTVWHGAPD